MSSIEKAAEKLNKVSKTSARTEVDKRQPDNNPKGVVGQAQSPSTQTANISSGHVAGRTVQPILPTLEANAMLTPNLKDKIQAEEYRQIKRPILSNIKQFNAGSKEHRNVIMVTSALPGEGKTYTTINLAMSIAAERDVSVLLVDCDVIRHSLSTFFNLGKTPGLIDYLNGNEGNVDDLIVQTDVPSLSILPAGYVSHESTELLASDEMGRLVDDIAKNYSDRIIIFDSPPLLITSQSLVLTGHAGQILVVVEEGVTPQKAVLEAIDKLDKNKIIGTVLNKRSRFSPGEKYGGYYYGNYGE